MDGKDRTLVNSIIGLVNRGIEKAVAGILAKRQEDEERWVTGKTLGTYIETMTDSWLKDNGHTLPRTRAEIENEDGSVTTGHWLYPLHAIEKMLWNGDIKHLAANRTRARLRTA